MKLSECCKRAVVSIDTSMDVSAAAKVMRKEHVGFLVVYREGDELRKPIGVLTDRDLVVGVMARDVDPRSVTVADVMTAKPIIAKETDDLTNVVQAARRAGIRRMPVVDSEGALIGIIAVDDAIAFVAGLMSDITGSIGSEQQRELRTRVG